MAYFKLNEIPDGAIAYNDDYFFDGENRDLFVLCEIPQEKGE